MNSRCTHHPDGKAQRLLVICGCGRPHVACSKRRQRPMSEQESSPTLESPLQLLGSSLTTRSQDLTVLFKRTSRLPTATISLPNPARASPHARPLPPPPPPPRAPSTRAGPPRSSPRHRFRLRTRRGHVRAPPRAGGRGGRPAGGGARGVGGGRRGCGGWQGKLLTIRCVSQLNDQHFGTDGTEEVRDGYQDDGQWKAASVVGHRDAILRERDDGRIG